MKRSYKSRQAIIAAFIAEMAGNAVESYGLSKSEEIFYRSKAAQALDYAARKSSRFKNFYTLPTSKPFRVVLFISFVVAISSLSFVVYVISTNVWSDKFISLIGVCWTVAAAATGWCISSGISHRNTVRQNTQNLIFSRFSQTSHTEAIHRFHSKFGYSVDKKVTREDVTLAFKGDAESCKAGESANYILNYFEFIACGVLSGDLDEKIITNNIRGIVIYYFDKCEPYIFQSNKINPRSFTCLIKLRTSYRNP